MAFLITLVYTSVSKLTGGKEFPVSAQQKNKVLYLFNRDFNQKASVYFSVFQQCGFSSVF